ncbi:MAG TPA: alpha/beta fold hydrolase [Acidobacteriota bacterium]|nr:alpha/beta fold hydrolase [Acidobacteriota bacterium]
MIYTYDLSTGVSLRVNLSGEGEPIVFIHGLGGNFSFWAGQVRDLAYRFQVIRYDLRGHGGSSVSSVQTPQDHVADLAALLETLEIDQVRLVGLSMGGVIAQTFAATYPERVRQLVLVSTTSAFPPKGKEALAHLAHLAETQGMRAVADAFAPRLFGSVIDLKLDDRFQALAAAFTEQDPASFAATYRALALADVTPELSKIQTETLLVYGENDRQTPPFFGEALVSKLPNARMVVVPKLGHVLPIEDPKTFNRILLEFLR